MYQVVPKIILAYIVIALPISLLNLENMPKNTKNEPKNHFGTEKHT
jgi:Na+/alanine symporter